MQELDIAMSHVRTIHRVAGMTGREKNAFSSGYNIVRLKLSNIAKNRNLQEVEVEESEPDRNISDSDSDW